MAYLPLAVMQYLLMGGLAVLTLLVDRFVKIDRDLERIKFRNAESHQEFDFIVVGAGTAGSVVANRLSQNFSVLLIEAGGDPFRLMKVPGLASAFPTNKHYDWGYRSVPQTKSCLSLINRQSLWINGRALGGSSNLNYMAYIRGHHLDYDNWARITDDQRWSYKNFLKYYKKHENYHVTTNGKVSDVYFGKGGEVQVNSLPFRPIAPYFFEAAKELGYKVIEDINAPFDEAFGNYSFTINNGRRWGTYTAFLNGLDAKSHRLTIYKYSTATRIIINNGIAQGVEYEYRGKHYKIKAKNEVIVSAGTVGSPKLLMLSGIGPSNHLTSLEIPVKLDLPVGENLQDHIIAFVGPFTIKPKLTYVPDRDPKLKHVVDFINNGTGPLTATRIEATALLRSTFAKAEFTENSNVWPDMQLILAVFALPSDGPSFITRIFNLRPEISEEYYRPVSGRDSFHIMSVVSRPKSRGNIRLANADYKSPPLIDPNYLDHPRDSEIILEGIQRILKLVEGTKAFGRIGAKLSPKPFPSCKHLEYRSNEYWKCYLKHYTVTVYHPVGTCAMGKSTSQTAVLDSSLRVHGVPNLRVIDASIIPEILSTNPQAAIIAIGEIGADFVKESWTRY